jgi:DNA invertase Pin-like site-specific DNA recombinase
VTEANQTLRAVIYTRVSSDRDGGGRSVDQQEQACRSDCDRNGWTVVRVLTENDRGASRWSRKDRPEFDELIRLLASGAGDIVVTWEASRSNRDLAVYVQLRDLCAGNGVLWCYNGRTYDLTDDDDRFSTGMDALVAEREAGLTRKRVIRDVAARAADGRPHGKAHDGLRTIYSKPRTGRPRPIGWELDPDRAPVIREIADRLLGGESAYGIAADLNKRGITTATGKQWRGGNIVNRMRSPTLAGRRVYGGKVMEDVVAQWPAIVTAEEHDRLLALLSDPRRKANKEGPGVKWLGSGIYRCGICDGPMRLISGYRNTGTRRTRYGCVEKFCVQRASEPTDRTVEKAVIRFLSRPDVMAELTGGDDMLQQEAAAEAARLRAELAEARAKVKRHEITLDDFADFRADWEPQLRDAERRAQPKWLPDAVRQVAGPDAERRWEAQTMGARRAILKALFVVRIDPVGGATSGTFDPTAIKVRRRES